MPTIYKSTVITTNQTTKRGISERASGRLVQLSPNLQSTTPFWSSTHEPGLPPAEPSSTLCYTVCGTDGPFANCYSPPNIPTRRPSSLIVHLSIAVIVSLSSLFKSHSKTTENFSLKTSNGKKAIGPSWSLKLTTFDGFLAEWRNFPSHLFYIVVSSNFFTSCFKIPPRNPNLILLASDVCVLTTKSVYF